MQTRRPRAVENPFADRCDFKQTDVSVYTNDGRATYSRYHTRANTGVNIIIHCRRRTRSTSVRRATRTFCRPRWRDSGRTWTVAKNFRNATDGFGTARRRRRRRDGEFPRGPSVKNEYTVFLRIRKKKICNFGDMPTCDIEWYMWNR